jgi:hypothetical protein
MRKSPGRETGAFVCRPSWDAAVAIVGWTRLVTRDLILAFPCNDAAKLAGARGAIMAKLRLDYAASGLPN